MLSWQNAPPLQPPGTHRQVPAALQVPLEMSPSWQVPAVTTLSPQTPALQVGARQGPAKHWTGKGMPLEQSMTEVPVQGLGSVTKAVPAALQMVTVRPLQSR